MVESIDAMLQRTRLTFSTLLTERLEIYQKFLAPWNITKAEKLRLMDKDIEKLFMQLLNLLNSVRSEDRQHMDTLHEDLVASRDAAATHRHRFEETKANLLKLQKDYADLHDSYTQLVEKAEALEKQLTVLRAEGKSNGGKKTNRKKN